MRGLAAVDHDLCAIHEGEFVGRHHQCRGRDLFGTREPMGDRDIRLRPDRHRRFPDRIRRVHHAGRPSSSMRPSSRMYFASPPSDLISLSTSAPRSVRRPQNATLPPSAANIFAATAPMPDVAPVIRMTLFLNRARPSTKTCGPFLEPTIAPALTAPAANPATPATAPVSRLRRLAADSVAMGLSCGYHNCSLNIYGFERNHKPDSAGKVAFKTCRGYESPWSRKKCAGRLRSGLSESLRDRVRSAARRSSRRPKNCS